MNAPEKLIGKAVPRREDLRFLTGRGQYTDDITLPQQSYGVFVRSPYAHARLTKVDIAAAQGTPVKAPAAGIVTFAAPSLYLTGGTVVIDHGAGVSSNFLHLSRIDVQVGDRVEQGQVFAAVGATGRATGPHLHWGMNWFDVRIDPLLVLPAAK